ncbi:MAG TPA: anthranilate phosphoribosyltransferase [Sandaracinaceae bacterium LLY-WYZ-13_1]|nr:anthranilate phosphoribosyltransferase [Sandaracinaceae bacterium LLY-WYZ-13_1]
MSAEAVAEAIARAVEGEALEAPAMEAAMEAILAGEASAPQIAALAVALRMRGESAEELGAAARVLRRRAVPFERADGERLLDTCGTGGDRSGTFNISTTAAVVVAACGLKVAKHGNRSVSSRSGSADVLEALGIRLDGDAGAARRSLDALGIAFFFAPAFHGALKHAAPVRRELGLRSFFNLLGPLANPASASHQLLGVYDPARLRQIAEVLAELGVEGAWVVHGEGGLDEVSPCGPTRVATLRDGRVEETTLEPTDFGLEPVAFDSLVGGDAAANARITRAVLAGEGGGPRAAVVINTAAALCASGAEDDPRAARERASAAIDRGDAAALLERWAGRRA